VYSKISVKSAHRSPTCPHPFSSAPLKPRSKLLSTDRLQTRGIKLCSLNDYRKSAGCLKEANYTGILNLLGMFHSCCKWMEVLDRKFASCIFHWRPLNKVQVFCCRLHCATWCRQCENNERRQLQLCLYIIANVYTVPHIMNAICFINIVDVWYDVMDSCYATFIHLAKSANQCAITRKTYFINDLR
jgi:hypothetical protein